MAIARVKTWVAEVLTAADLNAEFNNIINNLTPDNIGDYSANAAEMQTTADPYPAGSPSLATDIAGELARIRYVLAQITGETYWYIDPTTSLKTFQTDTIAEKTSGSGVTVDGCLIKDGGAAAVSDGTNIIKTKILDIGTWNMDSTATKSVAHGLTGSKIRGVRAYIIDDSNGNIYPLDASILSGSYGGHICGHAWWDPSGASVTLTRVSSTYGGAYDTADYAGTGSSRGYVVITYVV